MLTFGEAKQSRLKRISGNCTSSDDFKDLLNDAVQELMIRGNFWNTIKVMTGCIYNQCLTFPRMVSTVLALNHCGSAPPKNQWFSFDAVLPDQVHHWNRHGNFRCSHDLALADSGTSSVFNQIPCLLPRFLRFYITQPTDSGKTITIFGKSAGVEVLTTRSDGTIQPGLVISLAVPFVQTSIAFDAVDRVVKDVTDGVVYCYQTDGINLFPLATYSPTETLPEYRTSRLVMSGCGTNCDRWPSRVSALVKLKHIPVENDDDLILIDNLEAIALAIQSVKLSDAFDSAGAEGMLSRAVHSLNLQLREKLPIDQTPVRFAPFGTSSLRRQKIGYLT
jgi:hypothetical protein